MTKGKTYVKPGQPMPKGVSIQTGPRGGKFYEQSFYHITTPENHASILKHGFDTTKKSPIVTRGKIMGNSVYLSFKPSPLYEKLYGDNHKTVVSKVHVKNPLVVDISKEDMSPLTAQNQIIEKIQESAGISYNDIKEDYIKGLKLFKEHTQNIRNIPEPEIAQRFKDVCAKLGVSESYNPMDEYEANLTREKLKKLGYDSIHLIAGDDPNSGGEQLIVFDTKDVSPIQ
jgi:hypothetical protein